MSPVTVGNKTLNENNNWEMHKEQLKWLNDEEMYTRITSFG